MWQYTLTYLFQIFCKDTIYLDTWLHSRGTIFPSPSLIFICGRETVDQQAEQSLDTLMCWTLNSKYLYLIREWKLVTQRNCGITFIILTLLEWQLSLNQAMSPVFLLERQGKIACTHIILGIATIMIQGKEHWLGEDHFNSVLSSPKWDAQVKQPLSQFPDLKGLHK